MNALISASDIKTFYSALHCLSRFSDTFWLQCSPSHPSSASSLRLSAINPTNSAFCLFVFDPDFFLSLTTTTSAKIECQIQLKSLLSILRTRGRNVERLELRLTTQDICRFTLTLHCRHSIVKTHNLTYEPKRGLLPTADPNPANFFCINPSTASEWLDHFLSSSRTGEITLICSPDSCIARSKDEEVLEKGGIRKSIATEVKIAVEEFKEYGVVDEAKLTLSLREFKATVSLAEVLGVSVEVNFSDGDEPLFVRLRVESAMAGEFVIATTRGDRGGVGTASGEAGGGGGVSRGVRDEQAGEKRIAASVASSSSAAAHSGASASHSIQRQNHTADTSSSSSSSLPTHRNVSPVRIPNQSTPLPPPPHHDDDQDEHGDTEQTQPLFFPGASQLSLQPTPPPPEETFVQPTPVAQGGDPGEFMDPNQPLSHPPRHRLEQEEQQDDEEEGGAYRAASAGRKRFKPLF